MALYNQDISLLSFFVIIFYHFFFFYWALQLCNTKHEYVAVEIQFLPLYILIFR